MQQLVKLQQQLMLLAASEASAAADAIQTAADVVQTTADKAQTTADVISSGTNATNASTSASAAEVSDIIATDAATDAAASKLAAASSETNAGTSATNAAASEVMAEKWADELEDVPVDLGQFSAYHWAKKSEASAVVGPAGEAATIAVGTTNTGVAGTDAAVANSGSSSAAVFDFTIPRGDKGDKGDTGGGLSAVVDDTTPVLGGPLNCNSFTLNDSSYRQLSDSNISTTSSYFMNYLNGDLQKINTTGGITVTIDIVNFVPNVVSAFVLLINTDGSASFIWPAAWKFAGGSAPDLSAAGQYDLLVRADASGVVTVYLSASDVKVV